jgi:hypothetical protein
VQGDDLVAEDVVARGDGGGDCHGGGEAVLDELVGDPGVGRRVDDGLGLDLDPLEAGLVDCAAVAVAVGEVVDDLCSQIMWLV